MSEFSWPEVLGTVVNGGDLDPGQARAAMAEIMGGRAEPALIAGFLTALRAKGETAAEMTGFVLAMLDAAVLVDVGVPVVDTAGTGGDGSGTFNISTTAAFIAAGAGARVAKHGNRAASSRTGSADVLEELGMEIELEPDEMVELVRETGFGFFFAPRYHPAMRHAAAVRRALGIPTVFNFLGPLCNPARARSQALGVADPVMAARMVAVLANLGTETAFVYYGEDGLDEITTTAPSMIYRLHRGEITHAEFTPEDFGVERAKPEDLTGGDASRNADITRAVLAGQAGPHRDIALVNAAPAIVAAGLAEGFVEAVGLGRRALDSGAAAAVLEGVVEASRRRRHSP